MHCFGIFVEAYSVFWSYADFGIICIFHDPIDGVALVF